MSLNKDKLFELDLFHRNYDFLSTPNSTNEASSRSKIGNCSLEESYAFNNVHHIYDQVYFFFLLFYPHNCF